MPNNALLSTHDPPQLSIILVVKSLNQDILEQIATHLTQAEGHREPEYEISENVLRIKFTPAPDDSIRRLIEYEIKNEFGEKQLSWEGT